MASISPYFLDLVYIQSCIRSGDYDTAISVVKDDFPQETLSALSLISIMDLDHPLRFLQMMDARNMVSLREKGYVIKRCIRIMSSTPVFTKVKDVMISYHTKIALDIFVEKSHHLEQIEKGTKLKEHELVYMNCHILVKEDMDYFDDILDVFKNNMPKDKHVLVIGLKRMADEYNLPSIRIMLLIYCYIWADREWYAYPIIPREVVIENKDRRQNKVDALQSFLYWCMIDYDKKELSDILDLVAEKSY